MTVRSTSPLVRRRTLLTVPPLLTVLAACGQAPNQMGTALDPATVLSSRAEPRVLALTDAPYVGAAVSACDELGAVMLSHRLSEDPASNAVVCPVGAGFALAMLYAGATDLPNEVTHLLGFEAAASYPNGLPAERDTSWSALQQSMQRLDSPSALEGFDPEELPERPLLHVADRLLVVRPQDPKAGGTVRQDYLDTATTWYGAEVMETDLDHAKESLDAWANLHTGGLVPTSAMTVTEDTRLVLQNAVLLAARWQQPFDADATEEGDFHRADGTTSRVSCMTQIAWFPVVFGEGWRALRMLYANTDSTLAMDLILPDDVVHPADLPAETWAEASALLESEAQSTEAQVRLMLPRLDLAPGPINLKDVLSSIGVELGSLPHIGDELGVGEAIQQVRLRVDEEGTVGAALTEVNVGVLAAPLPEEEPIGFSCDHPFVLRVVDRASGVCVFEAAVLDPAAE
ncbi:MULTISPECIES: serpin family protein [Actinomyces]|nr:MULTISPECIES: serpin family protein [Actinomyces]